MYRKIEIEELPIETLSVVALASLSKIYEDVKIVSMRERYYQDGERDDYRKHITFESDLFEEEKSLPPRGILDSKYQVNAFTYLFRLCEEVEAGRCPELFWLFMTPVVVEAFSKYKKYVAAEKYYNEIRRENNGDLIAEKIRKTLMDFIEQKG